MKKYFIKKIEKLTIYLFVFFIVTIVGGVVFLMFALTALMFDPNEGET